jgi:diguanylate cyclase
MRYPDSMAKSAEYLRLALPLMTRQHCALHPHSYALWYDVVSGRNAALTRAVELSTRDGGMLDEARTEALYQEHVAQPGPSGLSTAEAQRVSNGLGRVLENMAHTAAQAGDQTARFDQSLLAWSEQLLATAGGEQTRALQAVMSGTREMRDAIATLQQRLDANQAEIAALREEVSQARHEALVDALTGLANRRAFEQQMAHCIAAEGPPPCLILGDIDFFKRVNDSYGHSFGDQVLRAVARSLQRLAPSPQLAARVGGEEFALLLPAADLSEAQRLAEQLRSQIAGSRIRRGEVTPALERVTLSLGVTQLSRGESANEFFERADRALYASKRSGRNCVTVMAARAA